MSLHIDGHGKVHDDPETFTPTAQTGYRLSDTASTAAQEGGATLPRFELPHLELPRLEIPTSVYVALGVLGVAVVGTPLIGIYLLSRGARAVAPAGR